LTHENLTTSRSSIGDRLRVLGPPVSRFSRKHEQACHNSHYTSSVMQRCSRTRTFSSFPQSPMPFVLHNLSPILLPPWQHTNPISSEYHPPQGLLPSPLSHDHPPLVSIRGHVEQLPSIPVQRLLARVTFTLVISLVFIRAMSAVLALLDISFVSFWALKALATWHALPGNLQVLSLDPRLRS
jgi:hypothetical protein